jgi:hypothetical protein
MARPKLPPPRLRLRQPGNLNFDSRHLFWALSPSTVRSEHDRPPKQWCLGCALLE